MTAGSLAGFAAATRTATGRARTSDHTGAARPLGVGLIVVATLITYQSQLDLGTSWRIGVDEQERTDLVTTGMFSLVRNPIFSGMATAALGTSIAVPSPLAWLSAAALLVGMEIQVRTVEEPYLLRTHGQAYHCYVLRTGRFVLVLGRLRAT
jgi:protein-S-isoprenylcysteine O-methyltransferase Ste14